MVNLAGDRLLAGEQPIDLEYSCIRPKASGSANSTSNVNKSGRPAEIERGWFGFGERDVSPTSGPLAASSDSTDARGQPILVWHWNN
jgi:hypothetical protein